MTDDIVTRLRAWQIDGVQTIYDEAADEIERLRKLGDKWETLAKGVCEAITNEGKVPAYHRQVMNRHRSEWKTLWERIDKMMKEVRRG